MKKLNVPKLLVKMILLFAIFGCNKIPDIRLDEKTKSKVCCLDIYGAAYSVIEELGVDVVVKSLDVTKQDSIYKITSEIYVDSLEGDDDATKTIIQVLLPIHAKVIDSAVTHQDRDIEFIRIPNESVLFAVIDTIARTSASSPDYDYKKVVVKVKFTTSAPCEKKISIGINAFASCPGDKDHNNNFKSWREECSSKTESINSNAKNSYIILENIIEKQKVDINELCKYIIGGCVHCNGSSALCAGDVLDFRNVGLKDIVLFYKSSTDGKLNTFSLSQNKMMTIGDDFEAKDAYLIIK
jgi:hypothetical protein